MGWARMAVALAVLMSVLFTTPAAVAAVLRFSTPVAVGRCVNNGSVLRAVDVSGDRVPDLVSADGE